MAVIGVGHLGKEHARILAGLPEVELVGVADVNEANAQALAARLGTQAFADFQTLLDKVDAASIVVPTSLHENVAAAFLRRGIPVLVEKPLASTRAAADLLVDLAQKHDTLLQVGHIERFNPAFEAAMERNLQPWFLRAERLGPFSGRSTDTGVVMDLMIHDLDLLLSLIGRPVAAIESSGISVFGAHEDIAQARLHFAGGCVAEVMASRAHPTPSRQTQLWGSFGYAHLDFGQRRATFVEPSAQIQTQGLDPTRLDADSRGRLRDDLFTRYLPLSTVEGQSQDQLTAELRHFAHCVRTKTQPRVTGEHARDAIALAERILAAMKRQTWTHVGEPLRRVA